MLIVYAYDEAGQQIALRAAEMELPVKGAYMTAVPLKPDWSAATGRSADFFVVPAQWSAEGLSTCPVFGSTAKYVQLFKQRYGYLPDYTGAMASLGGVVAQLAIQVH